MDGWVSNGSRPQVRSKHRALCGQVLPGSHESGAKGKVKNGTTNGISQAPLVFCRVAF